MNDSLMNQSQHQQPEEASSNGASSSTFFCVGNNHRTANIATREIFYLTPEQIQLALRSTTLEFGISELAILSTCNRCEVFGFHSGLHVKNQEFLHDIYVAVHRYANAQHSHDMKLIKSTLYSMTGIDAVGHAFRVAASLDSLIPGETQITGQFKDAISISKDSGTFGPMLSRLSQAALATAKSVRTQTDIGRHRVSISHAAIDLARRASHDLSKLRFMIIGAGEMARVAAEYAASYKPKALVIANRSRQKAFELTEHLGMGEHHGLDNLSYLMARSDVVISATSAAGHVLGRDHVEKAIQVRDDDTPLFMIDIALPRDIDPAVAELTDVYLFDIDDLKSVVDGHMEKRRDAVQAASEIVRSGVEGFASWLSHQEVTPTISAASKYLTLILEKESQRTLSKEIFAELTPRQREALKNMFEAVAARFTADTAQVLKKAPTNDARTLAEALDMIFRKEPLS